jgi:hypothetical protein
VTRRGHIRIRSPKMASGVEAAHNRLGVVARVPQGKHTSERCRATHDVPYTLRCILDVRHDDTRVANVWEPTPHEDKEGNLW